MTSTERQAIKAKKEQDQLEVLSGIVDPEAKTYTFEAEVSVDNKRRKGTFTARYMTVSGRLRVGVIRAKLLDGAPATSVDGLTDDISYMLAYLQVTLIKTPAWFDYDKLDDIADLTMLFTEVRDFNERFRNQNEQNTNAGTGADSDSQSTVEDV